ncbi:hypothetical protein [Dokdonia sp.]|uniref:hypothetical protein n=1 Tax=Dokdonia sp. TaxID=2024995 RepID=UPI003264FC93
MVKEQALLVNFSTELNDITDLHKLEDKLRDRIIDKDIGEFDGHAIDLELKEGTIYMYGPSTDILYAGVKDILENEILLNGAIAVLRYGEPDNDCEEKKITIKAL